jgi:hypothetical protein
MVSGVWCTHHFEIWRNLTIKSPNLGKLKEMGWSLIYKMIQHLYLGTMMMKTLMVTMQY